MPVGLDGLNVRPPGSVEAPGGVAAIGEVRQELYQRALQRLLGQPLQGQVLSRYTDGSFLVKVADTAARIVLPANTEVGDQLPLTLVSVQPRPTFLLGHDADARLSKQPLLLADLPEGDEVELSGREEPPPPPPPGARSPASNLARQFQQIDSLLHPSERIPLPTTGQDDTHLPNGQPRSAQASLSSAAQLINSFLQTAQQQGATSALQGKTAIVPAPATAAPEVASALHDTLAYSGLFYEAHVHEWADGKRPIAELLREPQMQHQHGTDGKTQSADPNQTTLPQLVNLQLNTLEQQATHWRGEIWPGQQMEWDVQKNPQQPGGNGGGSEAAASWQSTVRFNLPTLGSISATLHMIGEHLHIQVKTGDDTSASLLRQHAPQLAEALGAAGSPLDSLLVQKNEQA
jgi:hypothetical protein